MTTLRRWCGALSTAAILGGCGRSAAPAPWQVSIRGYGPIAVGMTLAEASTAAGRPIDPPASGLEGCDVVGFSGDSAGRIRFLVENGRIERVDVLDTGVVTNHGASIGDAEARIDSLYSGRVTITPHKYEEGGHYLTVAPVRSEDSGLALVFETRQGRVTRYRSGRKPAVEYVEGCS